MAFDWIVAFLEHVAAQWVSFLIKVIGLSDFEAAPTSILGKFLKVGLSGDHRKVLSIKFKIQFVLLEY